MGAGGAGGGRAREQAHPAVGRLRRLPLVPRDGARELRGPDDGRADERPVRQHQGRPRGAPRSRCDLSDRARHDGRARRLAADDLPDAQGRTVLGRHLLSAGSRSSGGRRSPMCCARCRGSIGRTASRCTKNTQTIADGSDAIVRIQPAGAAARSGDARRRDEAACASRSTCSTAA